uniref:Uncharacterized protein n=1 Tax=Glossina austeni TaxID=7395 RepID=A0A1A9V5T9_GLOAU
MNLKKGSVAETKRILSDNFLESGSSGLDLFEDGEIIDWGSSGVLPLLEDTGDLADVNLWNTIRQHRTNRASFSNANLRSNSFVELSDGKDKHRYSCNYDDDTLKINCAEHMQNILRLVARRLSLTSNINQHEHYLSRGYI